MNEREEDKKSREEAMWKRWERLGGVRFDKKDVKPNESESSKPETEEKLTKSDNTEKEEKSKDGIHIYEGLGMKSKEEQFEEITGEKWPGEKYFAESDGYEDYDTDDGGYITWTIHERKVEETAPEVVPETSSEFGQSGGSLSASDIEKQIKFELDRINMFAAEHNYDPLEHKDKKDLAADKIDRPEGARPDDFSELSDRTIMDIYSSPNATPRDAQNAAAEIARRQRVGTFDLDNGPQNIKSDLLRNGYGVQNGEVLYPTSEYKDWLKNKDKERPKGIVRESINDRLDKSEAQETETEESNAEPVATDDVGMEGARKAAAIEEEKTAAIKEEKAAATEEEKAAASGAEGADDIPADHGQEAEGARSGESGDLNTPEGREERKEIVWKKLISVKEKIIEEMNWRIGVISELLDRNRILKKEGLVSDEAIIKKIDEASLELRKEMVDLENEVARRKDEIEKLRIENEPLGNVDDYNKKEYKYNESFGSEGAELITSEAELDDGMSKRIETFWNGLDEKKRDEMLGTIKNFDSARSSHGKALRQWLRDNELMS
ncbi:hypothetical protein IKF67_01040 [Candidatus Saccharibacteria bacterium]|nr:hypothetical protein [Candidatus Saccharibacteria bacterium]